jgi:hypothetical protein
MRVGGVEVLSRGEKVFFLFKGNCAGRAENKQRRNNAVLARRSPPHRLLPSRVRLTWMQVGANLKAGVPRKREDAQKRSRDPGGDEASLPKVPERAVDLKQRCSVAQPQQSTKGVNPNLKPVRRIWMLTKAGTGRPDLPNGAIAQIACVTDAGDKYDSARAGTVRFLPVEPSPTTSESPLKSIPTQEISTRAPSFRCLCSQ